MTIDERLERLAERHEALTQTVEHLALQAEEFNKRMAESDRRAAERAAESDRRFDERFGKLLTVVEDLATIARDHEHRLSNLEPQ